MNMRQTVKENPLLAILRHVPVEQTVAYAEAVLEGGVSFFEVALNSPQGLRQITMLRKAFGERILLGAGTAVTVDLARQALEAGARFLLTPSTHEDVLAFCQENKVPLLPGVMTPTDVALCLRYGFDTLKLFPAGELPRGYIKSLKGPFDGSEYVAIGGVTPGNLEELLESGFLGVGLGSGLTPPGAAGQGDWAAVTAYVAKLVERVNKYNGGLTRL